VLKRWNYASSGATELTVVASAWACQVVARGRAARQEWGRRECRAAPVEWGRAPVPVGRLLTRQEGQEDPPVEGQAWDRPARLGRAR
jgi:hypothetical protein